MDAKSTGVFAHKGANDRWFPASITKLMTAYTVLREIKTGRFSMSSPVRISANALAEPPTKMGLPVGTILTVENALKLIMVKSANDVATALGESIGGNEQAFAVKMNSYALDIGMMNSRWVNAHGLHDPGQYTTAHDMALLTKRLKDEFPQHGDLFDIGSVKIGRRTLRNHNSLLHTFKGTTGMKTGYICAGGLTLVASAVRQGREYIAVVFGHKRSSQRNLHAAELITSAVRSGEASILLGDLGKSAPVRQPRDISGYICGKKKRAIRPDLYFDDPAIELFAIRRPALKVRAAKVLDEDVPAQRSERVRLGGARGPDPYELLVKKPPFLIAAVDFKPIEWPELENGRTVALPSPNPKRPTIEVADNESESPNPPNPAKPDGTASRPLVVKPEISKAKRPSYDIPKTELIFTAKDTMNGKTDSQTVSQNMAHQKRFNLQGGTTIASPTPRPSLNDDRVGG